MGAQATSDVSQIRRSTLDPVLCVTFTPFHHLYILHPHLPSHPAPPLSQPHPHPRRDLSTQ